MSYQVTTKTSYGKRLGNSARGVVTGLLLFVAATALLWWNEGRAVQTSRMLNKAGKECVDVADVSSVDPSLNGKLIHAVAIAQKGKNAPAPAEEAAPATAPAAPAMTESVAEEPAQKTE